MIQSIYEQLGIDPHKDSVKKIFGCAIDNDFPGAFCVIRRDPWHQGWVMALHGDGDGSKSIQRWLHYFEKGGDESILAGMVDDALGMNTGDVAASGFIRGFAVIDLLNINKAVVNKEAVMRQIALRMLELKKIYSSYGMPLFFLGGETADLPDQVKSQVLDFCVYSTVPEAEIIRGNVQPGDVIFGFRSDGKAVWEKQKNSGIMSNGLTMGRTILMNSAYATLYPELVRKNGSYRGSFDVDDRCPELLGEMTVSEALLSPTRQWAIVIKLIIDKLRGRDALHLLHGISMNTGGGATKIKNIGYGIVYEKFIPPPPPIFQLIQRESDEEWRNMLVAFNCGIGLDVVGDNSNGELFKALLDVSYETRVDVFRLGECGRNNESASENRVVIEFGEETFMY